MMDDDHHDDAWGCTMGQDAGRRPAQLFLSGGWVQKMVRQKSEFEVKIKNPHFLGPDIRTRNMTWHNWRKKILRIQP